MSAPRVRVAVEHSPDLHSGVPTSHHEASRNTSSLSGSWLSTMNFARVWLFAQLKRNSGMEWRSAIATTSSDGGIPGRTGRSQEPQEAHTSLEMLAARY